MASVVCRTKGEAYEMYPESFFNIKALTKWQNDGLSVNEWGTYGLNFT